MRRTSKAKGEQSGRSGCKRAPKARKKLRHRTTSRTKRPRAGGSPPKGRNKRRVRQRLSPVQRVARLHTAKKLPLLLRGREFGLRELRIILQTVSSHGRQGRTRVSEVVCERLHWRQPNGWLKDRACRDVLRRLAKRGLVKLPPPLAKNGGRTPIWRLPQEYVNRLSSQAPLTALPSSLSLEFAKGNEAERVWNYLVAQHHYLGYRVAVGRCIKYLVRSGERVLGAIAFSSPVWRLARRDAVLSECGLTAADLHERVINNTRFVLLPGARIEHLASKALSVATQQVTHDWAQYYSVRPLVVETFVQPSRFDGTCYKAANWLHIGETRGFAKVGPTHHNSQEPKAIFLYGLNRAMRNRLTKALAQQEMKRGPQGRLDPSA